jgi:exonuclease VII large subunit
MSEDDPRDLFEKADALLGRYRGEGRIEPDFPTLTEVVEVPAAAAPAEAAPSLPPAATRQDEAIENLQAEITRSVHAQLDQAVAAAMETVSERLRAELEALLGSAEADARTALAEKIDQAVRIAIERYRASL